MCIKEAAKKKKTKKQIEADFPIIKPEDCPKQLMEWIVKRDDVMMEQLEELIERMFDKFFKKYITMIHCNRIWLWILSIVMLLFGVALYAHIYAR